MNLEEFLASNIRNGYFREGTFEVYARRGHHVVGIEPDRDIVATFDIAKVENHGTRARGEFWMLIDKIKTCLETRPDLRHKITHLYVESVLNERLERSLPWHGFTLQPNTIPPSFYRKLDL